MGQTKQRTILEILIVISICITIDQIQQISALPMSENSHVSLGNCPNPQNCDYQSMWSECEVSCPSSKAAIIVTFSPGMHLHIQCGGDHSGYQDLPKLEVGPVKELQIRRCPLPQGSSFARLVQHIGASNVRILRYTTQGLDFPDSLRRDHFKDFSQLERLVLSSNGLSNLEPDVFNDLGNLTWLDLRMNRIKLTPNIFEKLQNLNYLELANNNLSRLPGNIFRSLKNLTRLLLWGNNLKNLSKDAFKNAVTVEELDLNQNDIAQMQPDVFEYLTGLKTINLSANRFISLPGTLFSSNKKLANVQLVNNRVDLVELPERFLADLPELNYVDIRAGVHKVPEDLFTGSNNVRNITLAMNKLKTLPAQLFHDQINLYDLDLSENQLTELPDNLFQNTQSLEILRLSYNELTNISG